MRERIVSKSEALIQIENSAKEAEKYILLHGGIYHEDGFQGISVDELLKLGKNIIKSTSIEEAYDYMSQTTSSGDGNYYDRLIGEPQHLDSYHNLHRTLRSREKRIQRSIDIGGATGIGGVLLSQISDYVLVTDISRGLLDRANEFLNEAGKCKTFETRQINALNLNFDESDFFDVATSNAITHYLTYEEKLRFYRNIYSLLKPGGRYYEPQQEKYDLGNMYNNSPRGLLVSNVVGALLLLRGSKVINSQAQGLPSLEQFGFDVESLVYTKAPFIKQVVKLTKK